MEKHPAYVNIVACHRMELEILEFLLIASDDWPWWSVADVMDTTDEPILALDAIAALCDSGLLQRQGSSVMITRAALHFYHLIT